MTVEDLRSVVFSIQGDYKTSVPFIMEVKQLAFTKEIEIENEETETIGIDNDPENIIDAISSVRTSPNPFSSQTTIKMPTPNEKITISVVDMLGRIVQEEELTGDGFLSDTFTFTAKNLAQGVYKYIIRGDNFKKRYEGSFLIR